MEKTNELFKQVSFGNTTVKNRVGVAPMTRISATEDGYITDEMVSYYTSFAKGGFGLVITEGTYIDDQYSQTYVSQPGIAFEEQAHAWKQVADAVHAAGANIFMQLQHSGALSQGNHFMSGTIAPSAIQPKGEQLQIYLGSGPFPTPREITKAEIAGVIKSFSDAALRAKAAGFDGVEIHGANGYLLDQFLTDFTNERSDEYGGSAENRVRLLVEIAQAVRAAVGEDFTVGIRISQAKPNAYAYKWTGQEEDAAIIFAHLGKAGYDYIHITEYEAWQPAFGTSGASLAALAKKYSQLPIIANGHLEDPEKAAQMIESGDADMVTLGKGALANHDWVQKVQNGQPLLGFEGGKFLWPNAKLKDFEM